MAHGECQDVSVVLPWIANQSLRGPELSAAWRHLRDCPACRAELVQWVKLRAAVKTPLPDATAAVGRVWAALRTEMRQPQSPRVFDPFAPPLDIARQTVAWAIAQAPAG